MQRFTNLRIRKERPGPVRRPTRPTDKLSRRRAGSGVLLAAVSAIALTGAGTAGAVGRYSDPSGDGKGSADVTGVSVASDANGQILFTISTASHPEDQGGAVLLLLDTDLNQAMGCPGTLGRTSSSTWMQRATASAVGRDRTGTGTRPDPTVRVMTNATAEMFSVNRSELGSTESFNFWIRTVKGEMASGQLDDAPDDGTFNYTLAVGGPDIPEVGVKTSPASGPRAGSSSSSRRRCSCRPPAPCSRSLRSRSRTSARPSSVRRRSGERVRAGAASRSRRRRRRSGSRSC